MSLARRILAIVITVATMMCLAGAAVSQAQKVVDVAISGNVNINSDAIRNVVTLKPGMDYTEQDIEKDRGAIMSLGTFSAVTPHKEEVAGGVKVTYEVTENPKVTDIKIVGSEPVTADQVLGLMKTKPGQVLNTTTLNQDIEAIQSHYGDKGHIAYVTEDIGVDPKTGVLTVPILVNRVQDVTITGNKKTKTYVLLREMETRPGKVFNVKTLKEDVIRIYNLDILEDIKPYQITPGSEAGMVKITIPVVEKKTGMVSLGFGYSSKQRLVGQARLGETNFRGRAQGLNLLWQQGTSEAVGGSASEEIGFYEPWIDKNHTSLSVNGFNRLTYRFSSGIFNTGGVANGELYNERHKGADITLSRPLSRTTRVYVGGRFENVDTDPDLLRNRSSLAGEVTYNQLVKIVQMGDVTGGSVRLVHNSRDFDLDPGVGGYDSVSFEFGQVDASGFQTNVIQAGDPLADPVIPRIEELVKYPISGGFHKTSFDFRRYFSKGGRKTSPT